MAKEFRGKGPSNDPTQDPEYRAWLEQKEKDPWGGIGPTEWFEQYRPSYQPAFDPSGMSLAPELEERLGGIQMDPRGLEAFRTEALRTGPSLWAQLAGRTQRTQELGARERAERGMAGRLAGARGSLAMTGGLTSGARERLERGGAMGTFQATQDIARQGELARLGISSEDEARRMGALQALPGMELQAMQPEMEKAKMFAMARAQDIANQLSEAERKQAFELGLFQERGKVFGAERQAQATEAAGTWLCTEADRVSPQEVKTKAAIIILREWMKRKHPKLFGFYLVEGKELAKRMRDKNYAFKEKLVPWVDEVVELIKCGEMENAFKLYAARTRVLFEKFFPEKAEVGVKLYEGGK